MRNRRHDEMRKIRKLFGMYSELAMSSELAATYMKQNLPIIEINFPGFIDRLAKEERTKAAREREG